MTQPWVVIGRDDTPDGPFELKRRGDRDFLMTLGGRVVMTSAEHRSEDALAALACRPLRARKAARVLVSGLGMGFTLRAALSELAGDARVEVAELNAVTIVWCQGPLAALTSGAANDPRVSLEIIDVAHKIAGLGRTPEAPRFDAIVLDMYEGPRAVVPASDPLYGPAAVLRTRDALAPGGILAVWCESKSLGFERSLRRAEMPFELHRVGRGGRVHLVYVATRAALERRPTLAETKARPTAASPKRKPTVARSRR